MSVDWYALSVKQPWAALLVAGIKTVEVRSWSASRRGRILIHAGKIPDERSAAWDWITTPALRATAELTGGIIGLGELTDCIRYPTLQTFEADRGRHLNLPEWFQDRGLFGFAFRNLAPVPFFPYLGNTSFFRVEGFPWSDPPSPTPSKV